MTRIKREGQNFMDWLEEVVAADPEAMKAHEAETKEMLAWVEDTREADTVKLLEQWKDVSLGALLKRAEKAGAKFECVASAADGYQLSFPSASPNRYMGWVCDPETEGHKTNWQTCWLFMGALSQAALEKKRYFGFFPDGSSVYLSEEGEKVWLEKYQDKTHWARALVIAYLIAIGEDTP